MSGLGQVSVLSVYIKILNLQMSAFAHYFCLT